MGGMRRADSAGRRNGEGECRDEVNPGEGVSGR